MTDLNEVYLTGKTQRYHARPELAIFGQTDADHSWGVVMLLLLLFPDCSRNLVCAGVVHDCGERWAGDLPHPFKRANTYIAERHARVENKLAREHGVPQFELTEEEEAKLKLCDLLEAYLFTKLRRPDIIQNDQKWINQGEEMKTRADEFGVKEQVESLL